MAVSPCRGPASVLCWCCQCCPRRLLPAAAQPWLGLGVCPPWMVGHPCRVPLAGPALLPRLCFHPCCSCWFLLLHSDSAGAWPQPWALLPSRGRALHGARQAVGPAHALPPSCCPSFPSSSPVLLSKPSCHAPPAPGTAGLMHKGLCAGVRGWSLTWPCWLGTGCRVAAPPRGWERPRFLARAEQLGECLACASPGCSWLCLWAAGTGWWFRHLPVALLAWMVLLEVLLLHRG